MKYFDSEFFNLNYNYHLGCDEVGRGPLAGPVVSCCVGILGAESIIEFNNYLNELKNIGIQDSKKLSSQKRKLILSNLKINLLDVGQSKIYSFQINNLVFYFSLSVISNILIDRINILNASLKSMNNCIDKFKGNNFVLIDGNKIPKNLNSRFDSKFIIKGDQLSHLIGIASIIAKEWRDLYMQKMSIIYPGYSLDKHNGYPTKVHRESIQKYGITTIHRKTFNGCK